MNKLDKQFQASAAKIERSSLTPPPVKTERPKDKTPAKPNALPKRRRGVEQTRRASFEITPDLIKRLDKHIAATGVKKSQAIRQALEQYLD